MEKKLSFSEILKKYTMVIVLVLVVIMFTANTKGVMLLPQNVNNLVAQNAYVFILARWLFTHPDYLILDEPTRGIDVGAKYEIYCIINDLVAAGKSVIMISSELPEVLGMSDRIYIMNEGKFVGEVGKEEATSELIMSKIVKSGKGA